MIFWLIFQSSYFLSPSGPILVQHSTLRTICWWVFFRPQSMTGPFRISINLVQWTRSIAFCQSMTRSQNSSSLYTVFSDILLIIAPLVTFPHLNPNRSSPNTSSIFLTILLLSILAKIFSVWAMELKVRWSLHFVALGFFCKEIIVTSVNFMDHYPLSFVDQ